ncbi:hypothetical protein CBL_20707, partial [Carabus blaptoides fortunei]
IYPVMYVLMSNKSIDAYRSVLTYFHNECINGIEIQSVMADYESAVRSAVTEIFPNQQLHGCWFHFWKNVYKRARALNLVHQDVPVILSKIVKVTMALPLLPQDRIEEGFNYIRSMCEGIAAATPFLAYLQRQWASRNISVHEEEEIEEEIVAPVANVAPGAN